MVEKIRAKILLVDDEKDFVNALGSRLELRGLDVTIATSGEDAVDFAHNQKFDIVVLDLRMPGMDGLETLTKVKEEAPETEIIMLSGKGSVRSCAKAIKLGAEEFLEKPIDIEKLLQIIIDAKDRRLEAIAAKAQENIKEIVKNKSW